MKTWTAAAAVAFALALSSSSAGAATLVLPGSPFEGNDCSGVFGQGFKNCALPADIDPNETPIVAKFDFSDSGQVTKTSVNPLYPTVDGNEWTFDLDEGTWTYSPGEGDPAIRFFVAKGGPAFNLYSLEDDELSGDMFGTPINPNNNTTYGLSHLSFYDSGGIENPPDTTPEPTTMALLGLGLFGAGFMRGRRR